MCPTSTITNLSGWQYPQPFFLIPFIFLEQLLAHSNFVHKYRDFPYAFCSYTCIASSIINNTTTTINQSGLGASLTLPVLNFHAYKMRTRLWRRLNEVILVNSENSARSVGVTPVGGFLSASPCPLPHTNGKNPGSQRAVERLAEG